ncbi:hypothetical protein [Candidatus Dormiibacter inghamiae]
MRITTPVLAAAGLSLWAAAACGGATNQSDGGATAATPRPTLTTAVRGNLGEVLTDGQGRTLYHFLPEKDRKVSCTGSCATIWPPLLVPGSTGPTQASGLPGAVGVVTRPDGRTQVTYNEWPLYTFSGDKRPGDVAGQGIAGSWFVQTAQTPVDQDSDHDGTTAPAPSPAAAPAPTSAPAPPPPPGATPIPAPPPGGSASPPAFNDGDGDNRGGRSDGDGNG